MNGAGSPGQQRWIGSRVEVDVGAFVEDLLARRLRDRLRAASPRPTSASGGRWTFSRSPSGGCMSRMSPSFAAASSSFSTPSARHMRFSVPNWLMRSGCCEPFGCSKRSAGPPDLTTRSVISVISRSGSTSASMRRSSPCALEERDPLAEVSRRRQGAGQSMDASAYSTASSSVMPRLRAVPREGIGRALARSVVAAARTGVLATSRAPIRSHVSTEPMLTAASSPRSRRAIDGELDQCSATIAMSRSARARGPSSCAKRLSKSPGRACASLQTASDAAARTGAGANRSARSQSPVARVVAARASRCPGLRRRRVPSCRCAHARLSRSFEVLDRRSRLRPGSTAAASSAQPCSESPARSSSESPAPLRAKRDAS